MIAAAPTLNQTMTRQPLVSPFFIMLWIGRNFILQVQIFEDFEDIFKSEEQSEGSSETAAETSE